jgi:acetyl-CoA carboxylase biotin carboxylase subunit
MGISTTAVYSRADANSLHVKLSDEAICIGEAASADSYLRIPNIISAAEIADVEAIHPGSAFFRKTNTSPRSAKLPHQVHRPLPGGDPHGGDKIRPVRRQKNAASDHPRLGRHRGRPDTALQVAKKLGYPVIIKAASGGGGKGMRIAHNDMSLAVSSRPRRPRPKKPSATRTFT